MKNFLQEGAAITVAAPYAVVSGDGVKLGMLFGVAAHDAGSGAVLEIVTAGVFRLPKLSTDVVTAGAPLYWDDTNRRLTITNTSNLFVGHATAAAGSGATTVLLRVSNASKATG